MLKPIKESKEKKKEMATKKNCKQVFSVDEAVG